MPDGIVITLPCVIKARTEASKRIVEVEASNESVDAEGDVILQQALLDAGPDFVKSGHLDIDHISEIGHRLGIPDPEGFIVGRPLEVKDLGDKRTGVVGEIMRAKDGKEDFVKNRFDSFWKSLQSSPPVEWQASIYGFPTEDGTIDCSEKACSHGATRYLVKGIIWRSLAFTRNPVNQSLKGHAKIVTAKAFIEEFKKSLEGMGGVNPLGTVPVIAQDLPGNTAPPLEPSTSNMPFVGPFAMSMPRSVDELWGSYQRHIGKDCSYTKGMASTAGFRDHFTYCCGADPYMADLYSKALMYDVIQDRKKRR